MIQNIPTFSKVYTDDFALRQVQDNVEPIFKHLASKTVLHGLVVKDEVITTGKDNYIDHNLGREFIGWLVIRKNANADVWDSDTSNVHLNKHIILKSSANVTVTLWVF